MMLDLHGIAIYVGAAWAVGFALFPLLGKVLTGCHPDVRRRARTRIEAFFMTGDGTCDKCGQRVPRDNDAVRIHMTAGIERLPFVLPEEAHELAHEAGSSTLVYREGCPQCEQEKAMNTP